MQRVALRIRWGLIPYWAKDSKIGSNLLNARAEGIATKRAFRGAFKSRRCLIPADGFYEWEQTVAGQAAVPHPALKREAVRLRRAVGALAQPRGGDHRVVLHHHLRANELAARFHNRMPVIIAPEDYDPWLIGTPEQALALLKPYPAALMRAYPVSAKVNRPANDTPELVDPLPE